VLWPPNAILTSALLLVPVRSWWVCLAAVLPAHVVAELNAGFPSTLVAFLFLTNCSEALIAAGGLRLVSSRPLLFDTLQRVALFIVVVGLVAPIVSSFFDAAVVTALGRGEFWNVWNLRVFGNTLTELSVVPAVTLTLTTLWRRHWPSRAKLLEGCAFVVALAVVGAIVFGVLDWTSTIPGVPRTPTVFLLPLFLWASIRFGVGGVSAALLVCALFASISTAVGRRPFNTLPPLESLMAVQLYLTVIGALSMCLAGLLEERRQAAADLSSRLRFQALVALISGGFVRPLTSSASSTYDDCLARIGEYLGVDRVVLLTLGGGARFGERSREWRRGPADPGLAWHGGVEVPWVQSRLGNGQLVALESLATLPADALADRHAFESMKIRAAIVTPFMSRAALRGALLVAAEEERTWHETAIDQVRLLAEVLANASLREEAEFEVQRLRHELARVARVVSMGELTTSLAHELNQPLTGILSNAQAAARHLDSGQPSLSEVRAIVSDIIDDDRRARDVINRMREMLARRDVAQEVVDMNAVVRDVAILVTSESIIRNVSIMLTFAPQPARVVGKRVELQQAILNVVTNAMEAVAGRRLADRVVDVRVEVADSDETDESSEVVVSVADYGEGFPAGSEELVFEPSFEMQASDLSMDLAVVRSIVENHSGRIAAANSLSGGAVVTIALPGALEPCES
jgi:signal transduction histidine kinase/integral membrane sensor domain MASE1